MKAEKGWSKKIMLLFIYTRKEENFAVCSFTVSFVWLLACFCMFLPLSPQQENTIDMVIIQYWLVTTSYPNSRKDNKLHSCNYNYWHQSNNKRKMKHYLWGNLELSGKKFILVADCLKVNNKWVKWKVEIRDGKVWLFHLLLTLLCG